MLSYIYDGTYSGLLCAVRQAFHTKQQPDEILAAYPQTPSLFTQFVEIPTDKAIAQAMEVYIQRAMGNKTLDHVYYVSLSDHPQAPLLVYEYLKLGQRLKQNLDRDHGDPVVRQVHTLSRQVTGERHRLLGLARFQKLPSGVYYSKISPDHRVLALMAPHFASRFGQDRWVLHDLKRGWAVFGDCGRYQLAPLAQDAVEAPAEDMANLWQQYFAHITIAERVNPRCQANYMPRRYWENLTERPGEAAEMQRYK